MAKSTPKRRPRTSAQSRSKTARPAKAVGRRAATSRAAAAKTAKTPKTKAAHASRTAASRGAKRPKTAPKAQARAKSAAKKPAAATRPSKRASAKPKGRKGTKPVVSAKTHLAARPSTPRKPVTPTAAVTAAQKARSPEVAPLTPGIPSSLAYANSATAARSGAEEIRSNRAKHTDTSPALTGGDIDASWEEASSTGDEAPGGDNLTPDQDVVEEIGSALGIEYADEEELQGGVELEKRDRHRWEYDPASADDYIDRLKNES